jgi:transposase
MGARLRVFLTSSQDKTLLALSNSDAPKKVKNRAEIIRLNARGWYVEKIAAHFNWTAQTVRLILHRWQKQGIEGLWGASGRGTKSTRKKEDIVFLEECLKKEALTYNSFQLAEKLECDRKINLSSDSLKRILKKRRKSNKEKKEKKSLYNAPKSKPT